MAQQPRQHKQLKVAQPLLDDAPGAETPAAGQHGAASIPNSIGPTAGAATPVHVAIGKTASPAQTLPVATALPSAASATTPATSDKAASADVATAAEATAGWSFQRFVDTWLYDATSWLTSMLVHLVLLLGLGLVFIPEVRDEVRQLVSSNAESPITDEISEIEIENTLPDVEMEQNPTAETVPLGTETGEQGLQGLGGGVLEIGSVDEAPAATMDVQVADVGAELIPHEDLTKSVGAVMGHGLEGRGEAERKALVASGGGTAASEEAVERALEWLARHQNPDGSWSFDHSKNQCQGRCANPGNIQHGNLGATGLALLPFLGAGQTQRVGKYQRTVQMGLYYLVNNMKIDANGGSLMDEGVMYSHGICAICLCECYAMTRDPNLQEPAQQALNFIVYAQDKIGGGWRYAPGDPGDTSVVGWQLMALKSGHMAYLSVPPATIQGITNFLNSTQSDSGSAYGYTGPGNGLGTTSVGLLCRMYLGWDQHHPSLERGVERLGQIGPSEGNVYYNYYATQVLHHFGGDLWDKWNKVMREYLINTQSKEGHEEGSWYFRGGDHGADRGGRLYITALCCMTLEVYYRHLPIYGKSSIESEFDEAAPDPTPKGKKKKS